VHFFLIDACTGFVKSSGVRKFCPDNKFRINVVPDSSSAVLTNIFFKKSAHPILIKHDTVSIDRSAIHIRSTGILTTALVLLLIQINLGEHHAIGVARLTLDQAGALHIGEILRHIAGQLRQIALVLIQEGKLLQQVLLVAGQRLAVRSVHSWMLILWLYDQATHGTQIAIQRTLTLLRFVQRIHLLLEQLLSHFEKTCARHRCFTGLI